MVNLTAATLRRYRRPVILCCKLPLTALLLYIVLRRVDWSAMADTVAGTKPLWLGAGGLAVLARVGIVSRRWKLLLAGHGVDFSFSRAYGTYLVSGFFDSFIPAGVGGDLYRIKDSSARGFRRSGLAVFWDRLFGLVAQTGCALVAVIGLQSNPTVRPFAASFLLAAAGILLAAGLAGTSAWCLTGWSGPVPWLDRAPRVVRHVFRLLRHVPRISPRLMATGLSLSVCSHLLLLTCHYCVLCALGLESKVTLLYLVLAASVATVCLHLPITVNGIGVSENIFYAFFAPFGVSVEASVAFAWLLLLASRLPLAVMGGVLFALRTGMGPVASRPAPAAPSVGCRKE